jgi:hypothetical protein
MGNTKPSKKVARKKVTKKKAVKRVKYATREEGRAAVTRGEL